MSVTFTSIRNEDLYILEVFVPDSMALTLLETAGPIALMISRTTTLS
jgi:hypothetical protein